MTRTIKTFGDYYLIIPTGYEEILDTTFYVFIKNTEELYKLMKKAGRTARNLVQTFGTGSEIHIPLEDMDVFYFDGLPTDLLNEADEECLEEGQSIYFRQTTLHARFVPSVGNLSLISYYLGTNVYFCIQVRPSWGGTAFTYEFNFVELFGS